MTDRRRFIFGAAASAFACDAKAGARFYLSAHQHRLVVRGYGDLVFLGAEAACDNFDHRPRGFRLFEVRDDFSYSWNFIEL